MFIVTVFPEEPRPIAIRASKQFLASKKKILDAFDQAKEYSKGHKVPAHHGRIAESEFRNWLTGFLPKRYGVTSGFIVSQHQRADTKFPHYDVIIYDQIESPILWIEDSPDSSERGQKRAIPAEYTKAVTRSNHR